MSSSTIARMTAPALRYPALPMAVPKQKQSHARTSKRRAQHKIAAPAVNACPQCHSPRRPHRVCPVCGSYGGREVVTPGGHDHHDHDH
jgi:large subunit ribosomal protein L32